MRVWIHFALSSVKEVKLINVHVCEQVVLSKAKNVIELGQREMLTTVAQC